LHVDPPRGALDSEALPLRGVDRTVFRQDAVLQRVVIETCCDRRIGADGNPGVCIAGLEIFLERSDSDRLNFREQGDAETQANDGFDEAH
jgi:hypothetical protein